MSKVKRLIVSFVYFAFMHVPIGLKLIYLEVKSLFILLTRGEYITINMIANV